MHETNLDIYGAEPIPWSRVLGQLQDDSVKKTYWLATVRPDGRPHVAGVGAVWLDGTFYFTSGEGTRKSRNLAENPSCVLSVSLPDLDLVVEGAATPVTDSATLQRLAERYTAQGWPASVDDSAFTAPYSAPSAGTGALASVCRHAEHSVCGRHPRAKRRHALALRFLSQR